MTRKLIAMVVATAFLLGAGLATAADIIISVDENGNASPGVSFSPISGGGVQYDVSQICTLDTDFNGNSIGFYDGPDPTFGTLSDVLVQTSATTFDLYSGDSTGDLADVGSLLSTWYPTDPENGPSTSEYGWENPDGTFRGMYATSDPGVQLVIYGQSAATPEPGTLVLTGMGAVGLLAFCLAKVRRCLEVTNPTK
jgi:hypothetical protein